MSKKNWTRHFAKFVYDYMQHEIETVRGTDANTITDDLDIYLQQAIDSYESQNNVTIVFVKNDEKGVAK